MKILLFGRTGQLAIALQEALPTLGELVVAGREVADFNDAESVTACFHQIKPDMVVNAVAYTNVDGAESHEAEAMQVNAQTPGQLAAACAQSGVDLVHYSTDYVFDGHKDAAYSENDSTGPLNVYGRSKLAGEQAILREYSTRQAQCLILRTSWVYSANGKNFFNTMRQLLSTREQISVVKDQFGAPTWTVTIARVTQQLIAMRLAGKDWKDPVLHLTATDSTNWQEFTLAIKESIQKYQPIECDVRATTAAAYPSACERPVNSRLSTERIRHHYDLHLPTWREALEECVSEVYRP